MKKWSEIKQATLYKLFLSEEEARQQEYLSKFQYLANECLDIIANGVKPRIVAFTFGVYPNIVYGSDFKYDSELGFITYNQDGVLAEIIPSKNTAYVDGDKVYVFSNGLILTKNTKAYLTGTNVITMPEDFLSFADMINYHNNKPWDGIVYLGDRDFAIGEDGDYVVYYNALWEYITEEDIQKDTNLTTHLSVLSCLPSYIASQCLAQDDVQRSASLKNDFELLLSRLDTNIMYQNNHYKSSGGWY